MILHPDDLILAESVSRGIILSALIFEAGFVGMPQDLISVFHGGR